MKRFVWTIGVLAAVTALAPRSTAAQGVTTAAIAGVVTDSAGAPLTGATVVAVHGPSGTQYSAVTRADGRFNIPGMRVGGPYRVRASFVGYRPAVQDGRRSAVRAAGGDARVRAHHRHGRERPRVQLRADRGRDDDFHDRDRASPDDHPPGRGPVAAHAAVQSHGLRVFVRRPGQSPEQHDRRRLVLQQLVRTSGAARRPHQRGADLARRHSATSGERGPVRRAPRQFRWGRHQPGHQERNQRVQWHAVLRSPQQ